MRRKCSFYKYKYVDVAIVGETKRNGESEINEVHKPMVSGTEKNRVCEYEICC